MARQTAQPGPDQRSGQRFTLLLRVAKLVTGQGEFLCVLRDVSDRGIKAKLFHDLTVTELCLLDLGGGERHRLDLVWQRDGHAGFRFADGPIAIGQLIEEAGPFPKRHMRLALIRPVPVLLNTEGLSLPAQLVDISQHGAAVELDQRLALGRQLRIAAPPLPALHARVRWRRGGQHGLVFQEGFRLDALAQLAGQLQLPGDPAALDDQQVPKISPALTTD